MESIVPWHNSWTRILIFNLWRVYTDIIWRLKKFSTRTFSQISPLVRRKSKRRVSYIHIVAISSLTSRLARSWGCACARTLILVNGHGSWTKSWRYEWNSKYNWQKGRRGQASRAFSQIKPAETGGTRCKTGTAICMRRDATPRRAVPHRVHTADVGSRSSPLHHLQDKRYLLLLSSIRPVNPSWH